MIWEGDIFVGPHEVLHMCDTAASVAFFLFVARYVVPYERPSSAPVTTGELDKHSDSFFS